MIKGISIGIPRRGVTISCDSSSTGFMKGFRVILLRKYVNLIANLRLVNAVYKARSIQKVLISSEIRKLV